MASALLERDSELEAVGAALDAARDGAGRLVVIEGHAGLGKSNLVAAARGFAKATGVGILEAAGSELERDFPFGVALQLLEPRLAAAGNAERERLLSGAAALAGPLLAGAEAQTAGRGTEDDVFPLLHGLYWLTSNLAERGPLLVAVDDAHWADQSSLRFLLYLAQRLSELPVTVLVTRRPGGGSAEDELLDKLAGHPAAERRGLAPLSPAAVERLVRASFADEVDRAFARACAEVTGGNPLLLHQLLAALEAEGLAPSAAAERRVRELGPESVSRSVLLRLSSLQLGATSLARAGAVLGDGAPRRRVAALARLEPAAAADAADSLAAAEVLRAGEPLAFVHPIVRAAIYAELPAAELSQLHAEAARLLGEDDAPPEEIATHLVAGEPSGDEWAVDVLRVAAERAMAAGAPASAVRCLERALLEPPAREVRPALLVELGRAAAATGDPRAVDHLEQAIVAVDDPRERAEILASIGHALNAAGRHREAAETFDRGLDQLGDRDPELAVRLEAGYVGAARLDVGTLPLAVARLRPVLQRGPAAETGAERVLLAHVAHERALAGAPAGEVVELARAALGGGRLLEDETADGTAVYLAAAALLWADEVETVREVLAAAVDDARRRGSVLGYAAACNARARLHFLTGRMDDALADARAALETAGDTWRLARPAAHATAARALLERGELEAAEESLALPDGEERWQTSSALAPVLEARGWLELARGQAGIALEWFARCRRHQTWTQAPNPAVMPWRSGMALAAAAEGEHERASELVGQELELARAFGAPRALGVALRTAGLLAGGEERLELLERASDTLARSPARLELARARTELGAALRRAGRRQAAQEQLRLALDLAHRSGASALAERAKEELSAAGARPRRPLLSGAEALTASERRVAELAADGMTNREIAQALFVTVKTVEWHLRNSYLKLGIGSRRELAGAMEAEREPAAA